jgi:hypothetical protein
MFMPLLHHNRSSLTCLLLLPPHCLHFCFLFLLLQLLHPQTTLQLCFLGCVLLREAVTAYDLMGWALDGQVPFLELPHLSMQVATGEALVQAKQAYYVH